MSNVYLSVWPSKKRIQMITILLGRLPNAQEQPLYVLTLEWNSENLETVGIPNFLEYIYINKFVGREIDLLLVKVFLENAKALVKLATTFQSGAESDDGKKSKIIEKLLAFPRASTNLETVGIPNFLEYIYINKFVGREIDLLLVKVFLENAKALVKLATTFQSGAESDDGKKSKIIEKLLAFPRASTKTEEKFKLLNGFCVENEEN
ncbi:uncharacterized protein LOC110817947 [Carica papaya]|uniref:uncharacterized protein LOC110817947 n=1 Tax=Carica papaya TaxID=3649 RepID=UPI000B8D1A13|nr:uncharacterized protein LOC110817947 [Carica papaya]